MKIVAVVIAVLVVVIVSITIYLSPDDLANCHAPAPGTCAPADAIVVVSGGDTNARVQEGVGLFQQGWGKQLIFSGAAADPTGLSNAQAMKQYAVRLGVSEALISIEEFSRTTSENAANTSEYMRRNNISRIILVTSGYHQRRAGLEFQRQAGSDVVVINHPVPRDKHWSRFWWATPYGWWLALGELGKIIVHYLAPGVVS